ncbi:MAG: hypothetical protein IJE05_07710 [Clostridia bacterium]|nr:hypothetical protein [Clostridia bacterium]
MANITKDVKNKPAGLDVNFEIDVMDINNIVENKKYVLKANGKRIPTLSTELYEGKSIKAYAGGKAAEEKTVKEEIQH